MLVKLELINKTQLSKIKTLQNGMKCVHKS